MEAEITLGRNMKTILQIAFAILFLGVFSGFCGSADVITNTTRKVNIGTPAPEVFQRWARDHSYYALLEIVDAFIDPRSHHATKADVRKYLGKGYDDTGAYPNSGPNRWVYTSSRLVPYGSYLLIEFDDHQSVKAIDWVSE